MDKVIKFIKHNYVKLILLVLLLIVAYKVDFSVDRDSDFYFKKEDIYYEYIAAKQIHEGDNPYTKVLEGDMLENDKYATLLPHYYSLLYFIRDHSNDNFSGFI